MTSPNNLKYIYIFNSIISRMYFNPSERKEKDIFFKKLIVVEEEQVEQIFQELNLRGFTYTVLDYYDATLSDFEEMPIEEFNFMLRNNRNILENPNEESEYFKIKDEEEDIGFDDDCNLDCVAGGHTCGKGR